jgi:hypothetical protein
LSKTLQSTVQIVSNGKTKNITILEAIVKQHANKAANGDTKAARLLFDQLKGDQSGSGDNLSALIQEFRARHAGYPTDEPSRREQQSTEDAGPNCPPVPSPFPNDPDNDADI